MFSMRWRDLYCFIYINVACWTLYEGNKQYIYLHNIGPETKTNSTTIQKKRWPTKKSTQRLNLCLFIYSYILLNKEINIETNICSMKSIFEWTHCSGGMIVCRFGVKYGKSGHIYVLRSLSLSLTDSLFRSMLTKIRFGSFTACVWRLFCLFFPFLSFPYINRFMMFSVFDGCAACFRVMNDMFISFLRTEIRGWWKLSMSPMHLHAVIHRAINRWAMTM